MGKVQADSRVKVRISGSSSDGYEFSTNKKKGGTLEIQLGRGEMLASIEEAIIGMEEGEKKEFTLTAEQGIPRQEELILQLDREVLPKDRDYEVDDDLVLSLPGGDELEVTITMMTETHVLLDANPPIAGKALNVSISLIKIFE